MIKQLPITEIVKGMVLGKPLIDSKGRVLMQKGLVLEDEAIAKLKGWGLKALAVDIAEEGETEDNTEKKQAVTAAQERKFKYVMKDSNMKLLFEISTKHLIKKS